MKKLITLLVLLGCSALAHAQTLTLGLLPAADSLLVENATEQGLFEAEGLKVKTIHFKSALEIGTAMRAGKLDGHFGDLMNVILGNASGVAQEVIATTTHTTPTQRHFGLVVSPQKASNLSILNDLKGRDTAVSSGTIIAYLLERMKDSEKLTHDFLHEVEVKQIPIRLQMLLSGKIDTALLPEPLVTLAQSKGGKVLWDDRKLHETLAVIAVRKDLLSNDEVKAFRKALSKSAKLIEQDPKKYREIMIKKRLLPKELPASYHLPSFSQFGTADGLPPLPTKEEVKRVGEWMQSQKLIKDLPLYEEVVRN